MSFSDWMFLLLVFSAIEWSMQLRINSATDKIIKRLNQIESLNKKID